MQKSTIIKDFTRGPIFLPLVKFALPFMLSNALQVLYTTVDMLVVGQNLGKSALSAVTSSGRMADFLTVLCIGLGTGGQIYLSQLIGQGRREELNKTIGTLFSFLAIIGLSMTILSLIFAPYLVKILNIQASAYNDALAYIRISAAGLLFTYGYNTVSAILRGLGDSKHPLLFVAIASVINLALDILFITKLHLGVPGAALATIIGQASSFIFAIFYLYKRRQEFGFDFKLCSFKISPIIFRAFTRLGIPIAVRFSAINISMIYVISLVNNAGNTEAERIAASALFGVGLKMDDIVTKVTQGIMQAATGMVGQNYGAKLYLRITKIVHYAWYISFIFYAIYTFFLLSYPKAMFSIFTSDPDILALAPLFANNIVWQFPGLVIMRGTNGFINGIGNVRLALIFGLLDGVILRIGCSYLLGTYFSLGLRGYILGFAFACYGMSIPSLIYLYFYPWQNHKLLAISPKI